MHNLRFIHCLSDYIICLHCFVIPAPLLQKVYAQYVNATLNLATVAYFVQPSFLMSLAADCICCSYSCVGKAATLTLLTTDLATLHVSMH